MKDLNHSTATDGLAIPVYQSRYFDRGPARSGLPRSTDIVRPSRHVGLVPTGDISRLARSPDPSYNISWVGLQAMVQERPVRVERRLSAILAADVAGYSRLMHNDEEATHAS